MNRYLIPAILTLASAAAAEPLTGTIADASLRRSVELVYVEKVEGSFPPPATALQVNQKHNVYLPRLLPVVIGTKVVFRSEDPELHNVFARSGTKVLFNQGQPPNQVFEKTFTQTGFVHLTCNIHKEMSAWVLVLQNPFYATPDPKTGAFKIDGVPPGTYALRVWGEKLDGDVAARKFPVLVGSGAPSAQIAAR